jgi:hypothetical protein
MPVIPNQASSGLIINIGRSDRMVDMATLTDHQKKLVWMGIKKLNPELAKMLRQDKTLAALQNTFNGALQLPLANVNRYFEAGLKIQEEQKKCHR